MGGLAALTLPLPTELASQTLTALPLPLGIADGVPEINFSDDSKIPW